MGGLVGEKEKEKGNTVNNIVISLLGDYIVSNT